MGSHPILLQEYKLGDQHYSCLPDFLTVFLETCGQALRPEDYQLNALLLFYRSQVEHVNGRIERHMFFQTPFRSSVGVLQVLLAVAIHTTNVYARLFLQYPPVEPWSHFPQKTEKSVCSIVVHQQTRKKTPKKVFQLVVSVYSVFSCWQARSFRF
jgi:hypothetical protein